MYSIVKVKEEAGGHLLKREITDYFKTYEAAKAAAIVNRKDYIHIEIAEVEKASDYYYKSKEIVKTTKKWKEWEAKYNEW